MATLEPENHEASLALTVSLENTPRSDTVEYSPASSVNSPSSLFLSDSPSVQVEVSLHGESFAKNDTIEEYVNSHVVPECASLESAPSFSASSTPDATFQSDEAYINYLVDRWSRLNTIEHGGSIPTLRCGTLQFFIPSTPSSKAHQHSQSRQPLSPTRQSTVSQRSRIGTWVSKWCVISSKHLFYASTPPKIHMRQSSPNLPPSTDAEILQQVDTDATAREIMRKIMQPEGVIHLPSLPVRESFHCDREWVFFLPVPVGDLGFRTLPAAEVNGPTSLSSNRNINLSSFAEEGSEGVFVAVPGESLLKHWVWCLNAEHEFVPPALQFPLFFRKHIQEFSSYQLLSSRVLAEKTGKLSCAPGTRDEAERATAQLDDRDKDMDEQTHDEDTEEDEDDDVFQDSFADDEEFENDSVDNSNYLDKNQYAQTAMISSVHDEEDTLDLDKVARNGLDTPQTTSPDSVLMVSSPQSYLETLSQNSFANPWGPEVELGAFFPESLTHEEKKSRVASLSWDAPRSVQTLSQSVLSLRDKGLTSDDVEPTLLYNLRSILPQLGDLSDSSHNPRGENEQETGTQTSESTPASAHARHLQDLLTLKSGALSRLEELEEEQTRAQRALHDVAATRESLVAMHRQRFGFPRRLESLLRATLCATTVLLALSGVCVEKTATISPVASARSDVKTDVSLYYGHSTIPGVSSAQEEDNSRGGEGVRLTNLEDHREGAVTILVGRPLLGFASQKASQKASQSHVPAPADKSVVNSRRVSKAGNEDENEDRYDEEVAGEQRVRVGELSIPHLSFSAKMESDMPSEVGAPVVTLEQHTVYCQDPIARVQGHGDVDFDTESLESEVPEIRAKAKTHHRIIQAAVLRFSSCLSLLSAPSQSLTEEEEKEGINSGVGPPMSKPTHFSSPRRASVFSSRVKQEKNDSTNQSEGFTVRALARANALLALSSFLSSGELTMVKARREVSATSLTVAMGLIESVDVEDELRALRTAFLRDLTILLSPLKLAPADLTTLSPTWQQIAAKNFAPPREMFSALLSPSLPGSSIKSSSNITSSVYTETDKTRLTMAQSARFLLSLADSGSELDTKSYGRGLRNGGFNMGFNMGLGLGLGISEEATMTGAVSRILRLILPPSEWGRLNAPYTFKPKASELRATFSKNPLFMRPLVDAAMTPLQRLFESSLGQQFPSSTASDTPPLSLFGLPERLNCLLSFSMLALQTQVLAVSAISIAQVSAKGQRDLVANIRALTQLNSAFEQDIRGKTKQLEEVEQAQKRNLNHNKQLKEGKNIMQKLKASRNIFGKNKPT